MEEIKGRIISRGIAEGELLLTSQSISFYGGVDPNTGVVLEKGHELEGKCIGGKILAFLHGKGSTVGSYSLYRMKKNGVAPAGIINKESEAIVAVGAIISEIPMLDKLEKDIFSYLKSGERVRIDGNRGILTVL